MQLFVEVPGDPHGSYPVDVARPRSIRDTVEHVPDFGVPGRPLYGAGLDTLLTVHAGDGDIDECHPGDTDGEHPWQERGTLHHRLLTSLDWLAARALLRGGPRQSR